MRRMLRRLTLFLFRRRLEREMDEEMAFHLAMKARELEAEGCPLDRARREAAARFGSLLRTRERCEEYWGWRWLRDLSADIRVGGRMLARRPVLAVTSVASLTLGIGGVITVFTIVHSVLLRPLPYRDPSRLVQVWAEPPAFAGLSAVSVPDYLAWRAANTLFEDMGALEDGLEVNLTGDARPEWLEAQRVTASLFPLLGVTTKLGRTSLAGDDHEGSPPVVILSHGLWQQRFGGDPGVPRKSVSVDGRPHEVVGVMPPGVSYGNDRAALWMPFAWTASQRSELSFSLRAIARLKPGVTLGRARTDLTALAKRTAPEMPGSTEGRRGRVEPLQEQMTGRLSAKLLPLGGAVLFLLLIACANVAGLLVAAGADRLPESVLRAALGAGRGRMIRQFLAESLVLGVAGSVLGAGLAWVLIGPLVALSPVDLPRRGEIRIDSVVLLAAAGLSLLSTALSGLLPAVVSSTPRLAGWLNGAGHRRIAGASRQSARQMLVIAQVAVALALAIGAALMIRTLHGPLRVDAGFDPANVLTFQVRLPQRLHAFEPPPDQESHGQVRIDPEVEQTYEAIVDQLRRVPGGQSASATPWLPMNGLWGDLRRFTIAGRPEPAPVPGSRGPAATYAPVAVDFFRTMRLPLIRGRALSREDTVSSPWVVVIDEALAGAYWPGEDSLGQHVSFAQFRDARRIVGIVGNVRNEGLARRPRGTIYLPLGQQPPETSRPRAGLHMSFVLRVSDDLEQVAPLVVGAVERVDRSLPVFAVTPLASYLSSSARETRFLAVLMVAFAAVAALLALVGVYGVARYNVAQRTHEFGFRVALGAGPSRITGMVLRQYCRLGAVGLVAGIALAFGLTRFLSSMPFGVEATDPLTFGTVVGALGLVVLAASYLPARRASRVDPVVALRHE